MLITKNINAQLLLFAFIFFGCQSDPSTNSSANDSVAQLVGSSGNPAGHHDKSEIIQGIILSTREPAFSESTLNQGLMVKISQAQILDKKVADAIENSGLNRGDGFEFKQLFRKSGRYPAHSLMKHVYALKLPMSSRTRVAAGPLLAEIKDNPNVISADYDWFNTLDAKVRPTPGPGNFPNDQRFFEQWAHRNTQDHDMDTPKAWETFQGSSDVIVAVIDTGVQANHEDLVGRVLDGPGSGAFDFIANTDEQHDIVGHGTHVAGIIAATGNNLRGVAGMDWNCKIMPLQVFQQVFFSMGAFDSDVLEALNWAAEHGAKVVNMSLGGYNFSQTYQNTVNALTGFYDFIIVAAAGNDLLNSSSDPHYPSSYDNVVSVAATDVDDRLAMFSADKGSNYGYSVDVSAPGLHILSTIPFWNSISTCRRDQLCTDNPRGDYLAISGTSMATPMVTGLVALVKGLNPGFSEEEVLSQILTNTEDIDDLNPEYRHLLGTGRINAAKAVQDIHLTQIKHGVRFVGDRFGTAQFPATPEPGATVDWLFKIKGIGMSTGLMYAQLTSLSPKATIVWPGVPYATEWPMFDQEKDLRFRVQFSSQLNFGDEIPVELKIWGTQPFSGAYYEKIIPVVYRHSIQPLFGFPVELGTDAFIPLIEDLNNDGKGEIVITGDTMVSAVSGTGTILWQRAAFSSNKHVPSIVSINGGQKAIYFASGSNHFSGWNATTGASLTGFPVILNSGANAQLFPAGHNVGARSGTVAGDIDNNGTKDIIITVRDNNASESEPKQKTIAFNANGTVKWSVDPGTDFSTKPALGDINGDGKLEVFLGLSNSVPMSLAFNGSTFWSAPTSTEIPFMSPILADINQDGNLEFIALEGPFVHAMNQNRQELTGWPVNLTEFTFLPQFVIAGDVVNSSPGLEIIAGVANSGVTNLIVISSAGQILNTIAAPNLMNSASFSQAVIGDVDADPDQEIVFAVSDSDEVGAIMAWNSDGSMVDGFPITGLSERVSWSNVALGDINGDGKVDLIIGDNTKVYAYSINQPLGRIDWPMIRQNAQSTGVLH